MKKQILILCIILLTSLAFAAQIRLSNGKTFSGNIESARDGFITLMDGNVKIIIPVGEISSVMDGTNDLTRDTISRATPPRIDAHYIQADDYFYAEDPIGDNSWIWVMIGKMRREASAETDNHAMFFDVKTGTEKWAGWWGKTRIATRDDLALGTLVICFDSNNDGEKYNPPTDTQTARGDSWFMAKITDMSEAYRGYIQVAGAYKISLNNLRVLIRN